MRQRDLTPDRDGYYRRNLGFVRGRRSQPKINLGTAKRAAQERLAKIAAIWQRIELEAASEDTPPIWDDLSLAIAKAIGEGRGEYRVEPLSDDPDQYIRLVAAAAKEYPEITILPANERLYQSGLEHEARLNKVGREMLVMAQELKDVVLEDTRNKAKFADLLNEQMLHQALDAYGEWIKVEKFDQSEGATNDTGMTRRNMVKQLKRHLAPDTPLSSLSDYHSVDQLFGILRKRPVTDRYGKTMARKTASNLIGELGRFLTWLHKSPEWTWRKPDDYSEISRTPVELESDVASETKEVPTYTIAQLRTLFEYATPLERLLIALGLNCAYGADQIGRLRIGEIHRKKGVYYIRRVRRKKKVVGIHRLFKVTVEGLQWAIQGREEQENAHVLLNSKGHSLWRKTKGGNRCKDIPNAWYRLLERVCADDNGFPRYGFNALRDTSSSLVRRFAGQEMASLHLTHRHQSSDTNLRRYANAPWPKLFKAHRSLEKLLRKVFAIENPWSDRVHQYVSQQSIRRMRELRKQDVPVAQIAREVGVAKTTVYRWVK